MIQQHADYRSYLKSVLADKISDNPSYSLRSFAKQSGLAAGFLSEVLAGKKRLSTESTLKIATALALDSKETDFFRTLVELDVVKSARTKLLLTQKLESIFPRRRTASLDLDTFRAISDWKHLAAVELANVDGVQLNAETISQRLQTSRLEARAMLDRLARMKLIVEGPRGYFKKADCDPVVHSEAPNDALRNFHRQTLAKAAEALTTQSNKEKFVGSETMAFDPDDLEKVNQVLEECFTKVLKIANASRKRKHVYHLGINFFNLTPLKRKQ